MENGGRYVILLFKGNQFEGSLRPSSEGNVFWLERTKLKEYALARDMDATMNLFDCEELSEFYYAPDGSVPAVIEGVRFMLEIVKRRGHLSLVLFQRPSLEQLLPYWVGWA